jgi:diacylglycerol O-acyltransferase/trehalose O-mycolyltransferase
VVLNKITGLKVTVMLPDGYDSSPGKKWPVLYLLQGMGDNSEAWAKPGSGDATNTAKAFPGIVVMPEAGRGFLMDAWDNGARTGPNWQRYYLDEVIPAIEARYPILPGRQNHYIGGASMGAYGALLLAGQLPGYFGTVISLSAMADIQSPEVPQFLPEGMGVPFAQVWGPVGGQYATANNPIKTQMNLASTRTYLYSGNGTATLSLPWTKDSLTKGVFIELAVELQNEHYYALAKAAGYDVTLHVSQGVHDWPYWERELPRAITWANSGSPKVTSSAGPSKWVYKTMEPHGNAWGLGYKFGQPTTTTVTIARSGNVVSIGGGTGTITVNPGAADDDASGNGTEPQCSFTATLPVKHTLPAGC